MNLVLKSKFGNMVSLQGNKIKTIPLSEGVKKKYITTDSDKMELRDLLVKIRYSFFIDFLSFTVLNRLSSSQM